MKVTIPAPEIPPKINKGGSQHQLDAMNAESNAPKLAARSALCPPADSFSVAPGDCGRFDAQQSAAGGDCPASSGESASAFA